MSAVADGVTHRWKDGKLHRKTPSGWVEVYEPKGHVGERFKAGRQEVEVVKSDGDRVHISPTYGDGKHGAGQWIPKASLRHFHDDLNGVVRSGNPETAPHPSIKAVLEGKAEHLGKGDDGVAFRHGDKVVKASTTVPFQPFNPGHLTPKAAANRLEHQANVSEHLRKLGVPGILPIQSFRHGDKAFHVRDHVEIPEHLTQAHIDAVGHAMAEMHKRGWALNDEVQVGLHEGKPVLFDTGKAAPIRDTPQTMKGWRDTDADERRLDDLYKKHGHENPKAKAKKKPPLLAAFAFDTALKTGDFDTVFDAWNEATEAAEGHPKIIENINKKFDAFLAKEEEKRKSLKKGHMDLAELAALTFATHFTPSIGENPEGNGSLGDEAFDDGWIEVSEDDYHAMLMGDRWLSKGAGHKHYKKVPTGKHRIKKDGSKGAEIFRYFYKPEHGGGVHHEKDFKVGASFRGDGGHWVIESESDGKLTLKHDESGQVVVLSPSELRAKLHGEHKAKLDAHETKVAQEKADVAKHGSAKQKAKLGVVEPKPESKPEIPMKSEDGKIEAVGDHIWGSRKDLATKRFIDSSKDLEGMSYSDAAAIVTKARLVDPMKLEDAKASGMSAGTAHMFMYLLSKIRPKPDDSAKARAAYVDDIRSIQGAMERVKTTKDFDAFMEELRIARRRAPETVMVARATEADYKAKIDELKRDNPGQTFKAYHAFGLGNRVIEIHTPAAMPYEQLGANITRMIDRKPAAMKDLRQAESQANNLDKMDDEQSWQWLAASTEDAKKAIAKKPPKGKPDVSLAESGQSTTAMRVGGVPVPNADPRRVKDTFNLREVDYGKAGYMTQPDREYHTKQLEGALHDLSDVLGVDPKVLSFNGRLGIAMGARGRGGNAAAHYEPGRGAINLTKFMGGGTLAHEWGHALDNIIAGHFIASKTGSSTGDAFLSQTPEHSQLPSDLSAQMRTVMDAMTKTDATPERVATRKAKIQELQSVENDLIAKNNTLVEEIAKLRSKPISDEHLSREIQRRKNDLAMAEKELGSAKAAMAAGRLSGSLYANRMALEESRVASLKEQLKSLESPSGKMGDADVARIEQAKAEIEALRGPINKAAKARRDFAKMPATSTDYMIESSTKGDYWGSPHEMFARAFETYIQDKLASQGRRNTYLVRPHVESHPYPKGEEKERIHKAMDGLFSHLAKSGHLEKALRRFSAPLSKGTPMTLTELATLALCPPIENPIQNGKVKVYSNPTGDPFPLQGYACVQGIEIDIENLAGSIRQGMGKNGPWTCVMHAHYGEIRGAVGADKEALDVYVGDCPESDLVVIVHQADPSTGEFDENKVMLAFATVEDALTCYLTQYDSMDFYGGHDEATIDELKAWISRPQAPIEVEHGIANGFARSIGDNMPGNGSIGEFAFVDLMSAAQAIYQPSESPAE